MAKFRRVQSLFFLVPPKRQIKDHPFPKPGLLEECVKKEFSVPAQVVIQALSNLGFLESKRASGNVRHFRRYDGFHIILTKRRKKKMREVSWDEEARITTLRIHKDSVRHDQTLSFNKREFLQRLEVEIKFVKRSAEK
jgi:hypothetical protein